MSPAAPVCDYCRKPMSDPQHCGNRNVCPECFASSQPAAPARTEAEQAEQAVLDAVFLRSYCERDDVDGPCETYFHETVAVFEAYRAARRGLK